MCAFAGERLVQVHQQDLPPADLPPDPSLQVDETERAQEEVPGLVSARANTSLSISISATHKAPRASVKYQFDFWGVWEASSANFGERFTVSRLHLRFN